MVDRVPEELWMEVSNHCTECGEQNHPQEKEMQEGKMVVLGGLQITEERKELKSKGEREKICSSELISENNKER